jgi:hypothetical protein
VIKVGAPLPLTGPLSPEGLKQKRGYDLWAEAANTVATLGAMAGGTAFTLRDLLGHKTVAVTAGYVARTVDPIRHCRRTLAVESGQRLRRNLNRRRTSSA